ncbi:MAG: hypothetical protein WC707_04045 [Candidatus Babeliaceae bacterium]
MNNKFFLFLAVMLLVSSCETRKKKEHGGKPEYPRVLDLNDTCPIVISIHGTLPPIAASILHVIDAPIGLVPAHKLNRRFLLSRFLYLLSEGDPEAYPLASCYSFGWSGKLTFSARRNAAEMLYQQIRGYKGPITLIGHSHGGNVALELGRIIAARHDTHLNIDKLILLATPIQEATAQYAASPIFKHVISLYSMGDWTQISDPQGTYYASKYIERCCNVKVPLFSERKLKNFLNVVQARVIIGGSDLGHLDFIRTAFVHQLPAVIDLLSGVNIDGTIHTVSIPRDRCKKPFFVELKKVRNKKKWVEVKD